MTTGQRWESAVCFPETPLPVLLVSNRSLRCVIFLKTSPISPFRRYITRSIDRSNDDEFLPSFGNFAPREINVSTYCQNRRVSLEIATFEFRHVRLDTIFRRAIYSWIKRLFLRPIASNLFRIFSRNQSSKIPVFFFFFPLSPDLDKLVSISFHAILSPSQDNDEQVSLSGWSPPPFQTPEKRFPVSRRKETCPVRPESLD